MTSSNEDLIGRIFTVEARVEEIDGDAVYLSLPAGDLVEISLDEAQWLVDTQNWLRGEDPYPDE